CRSRAGSASTFALPFTRADWPKAAEGIARAKTRRDPSNKARARKLASALLTAVPGGTRQAAIMKMTLAFMDGVLRLAHRHGGCWLFLFPRSAFQRLLKLLGPLLVQGLERLLGKDFDVFPLDRWNRALACLPTTPTLGTNWLPLAEIGATGAGLAGRLTEYASRHGAADI